MMDNERISAVVDDVITAILEAEECYNPDFDKFEVLAEVAKNAHINLLLEKHQRDKQATTADYETFFAQHEKAVKNFFAGVFEVDEQRGKR